MVQSKGMVLKCRSSLFPTGEGILCQWKIQELRKAFITEEEIIFNITQLALCNAKHPETYRRCPKHLVQCQGRGPAELFVLEEKPGINNLPRAL